MAFFQNSDQVKEILGSFFETLAKDATINTALLNTHLVIRFVYRDPDASLTIVATQDPIQILRDDSERKPDVEMTMKADIAHQFWLGKVNLPIALTRRQIVAKGPIPKILKLLPVIKPAYALYPRFLKAQGIAI